MAKRKSTKEYRGGRIKMLVRAVRQVMREHPEFLLDENDDRLHSHLAMSIPGYGHLPDCFNCGRPMAITQRVAGLHTALLLIAMAKEVRARVASGMEFNKANMIDVPRLATTDAIRHQTTIASYLNFVKQPEDLKHTGHWLITNWGWKALRGDPVPKSAKYWRGQLVGRSEETVTLAGMFQTHKEQIQRAIALKRKIRSDFRGQVEDYNPNEWAEFGGYVDETDGV